MNSHIEDLKNRPDISDLYTKRLKALKADGYETRCIEQATEGAIENIKSGKKRSFVIYGEPQSGKTEMMIALTAKLLDEGHKVIIHLLKDSVQLLEQNLDRFTRASLIPSPKNYKEINNENARQLKGKKSIIFCKKNVNNLQTLLEIVKFGQLKNKIIIDDEADFATPNAKINKGKTTKINELIGSLLGDDGTYIGVTATPGRLDLNNTFMNTTQDWVDFPPHQKYSGQKIFFPVDSLPTDTFHLKLLPIDRDEPQWCKDALLSFMASVAFLNLSRKKDGKLEENYSFLVHTSGKKDDHKKDHQNIEKVFSVLSDKNHKEFVRYIEALLKIAQEKYPGWENKISEYVVDNVGNNKIVVMNSDQEFEKKYKPATSPSTPFTVIIGGNIVSRGATFNNLLSMLFTRGVKGKMQQDTYIQRARMFGNRERYLKHFELTIPEDLYLAWHECFVLHWLAIENVRNGNGDAVWIQSTKTSAVASSSIDKANVNFDKGEMSYAIFNFNPIRSQIEDIISSEGKNLEKLKKLKKILHDDRFFPQHLLSYIERIQNDDDLLKLHQPLSISDNNPDYVDKESIARSKGFLGGQSFTKGSAIHHVRVIYNQKGKARLFYRHIGSISFLKRKNKK